MLRAPASPVTRGTMDRCGSPRSPVPKGSRTRGTASTSRIKQALASLAHEYQAKQAAIVAINANDPVAYPEDDLAHMRADAESFGYVFPYLQDTTQDVARAFHAVCTPEFYLFDRGRQLVYRGQFDESRPGNTVPVTGRDLRAALDAVLAGQPVHPDQRPSIGCNIKWR